MLLPQMGVVTDGPDDEKLREFVPENFENAQVVADFSNVKKGRDDKIEVFEAFSVYDRI